MNAKKIAENDNETTSMFDEYTKSMEEELAILSEKFSKNLKEKKDSLKSENRELKEKLEELSKSMEVERATLSKEFSKKMNKETT